jgi:hypothetical protein
MSSLIFVSLFSLRAGHIVETFFTKHTSEKGTISYTHYDTAVVCRHLPQLPAELRVYVCGTELISDHTVSIVIVKGYVPPSDVAGDLLLNALYIAPFPGNPSGDSIEYNRTLPDFHWHLLFGLGSVSGASTELPNGQVFFPVTTLKYVCGTTRSSTLSYAVYLEYLLLFEIF